MNKWIEKHLRKYAISNLSLVIIVCYGFGYLLQYVNPAFLDYLTLNTYAILRGQVWRLFTWVLVPPGASNLFFVLISMLFYYSIGTTLERTWGTWEYNKYIFSGLLYTVIGAFIIMAVTRMFFWTDISAYGIEAEVFTMLARNISTYYVGMSIFLAYAATFPEAQVLFMFLIPLKVKWLGVAYAVIIAVEFIQYAMGGYYYLCIIILASLLNFLVFWFRSRHLSRFSPGAIRRRNQFRRAVQQGMRKQDKPTAAGGFRMPAGAGTGETPLMRRKQATLHRCAICGRTEADDPTMEFRYCSRCEGSYEFCQEHLFSHIHAKNGSAPVLMQSAVNVVASDNIWSTDDKDSKDGGQI